MPRGPPAPRVPRACTSPPTPAVPPRTPGSHRAPSHPTARPRLPARADAHPSGGPRGLVSGQDAAAAGGRAVPGINSSVWAAGGRGARAIFGGDAAALPEPCPGPPAQGEGRTCAPAPAPGVCVSVRPCVLGLSTPAPPSPLTTTLNSPPTPSLGAPLAARQNRHPEVGGLPPEWTRFSPVCSSCGKTG
jgi:hypothetical protein